MATPDAVERSRSDGAEPSETPTGTGLGADVRPRPEVAAAYQQLSDADRGTGGESTADGLGYFSIGLGLAELLAPDVIAKVVGVKHPDERTRMTTRALGLREIAHGLAILSNQRPARSVWSRVAGDAIDLAVLGRVWANPGNDRGRTLFGLVNVLAVTALDVMTAQQLSRQPRTEATVAADAGVIHTRRAITVRRPVEEVYAFWRDFTNLPRFMRHLESVTMVDERRSHWVATAPAGTKVEWDAITTEDRENELIAWRSIEGADVFNAGTVRFMPAPGDRGTEVRVDLLYKPPLGKLGSKVAMLFREEPGQQTQDSLREFKQVMEIGEIVVSDASRVPGPHPATPDRLPAEG